MTRRRRVAITLEQCWHRVPGGTATSILELTRALADRPDLDVVGVSARHRRPPSAPFVPPVDVKALPLPRPALYEAWAAARWPPVELATGPVDVVHGTAVAVPPTRSPLVMTIHDLAFLAEPGHVTRHGNRFFVRGTEQARRHAALVLCPSEATVAECEAAGFDRDRLRLVPWGVRAASVDDADLRRVRAAHRLARPYVLFVGTIEPRKNLSAVVQGFRDVSDRDLDLVLVGPEGWNTDLGRLTAPLGARVRRLGFVPSADLPALYAGCSAFCYPSLREGFGLPVLEAMAHGAPVVTSVGTAAAEVAGDAALLVDPRDPAAVTAALDRIVDDPSLAEDLRRRGRLRASRYTWQRSAELTAAAYADVSDGRLSPRRAAATRVGVNLLWLVPGVVGGSEEYTTRLLSGLAEHPAGDLHLTLFVLAPFAAAHPDLVAAYPTVTLGLDGRHKPLRVATENTWLVAQAQRRRLDLVHHAGGVVPPVGAVPAVLTIHDLQPLVMSGNFAAVKRAYLRAVLPTSARSARAIVTPSDHARRQVIEHLGVPPDLVHTVHHGIAPVGVPASASERAAVRAAHGLGPTTPFFLYPAITYPHKNHRMLVRAFARVTESRPDTALVLTGGEAGEEQVVGELVATLGLSDSVRRLGRIPRADLDVLLGSAVALTFPSRFEGFGAPVLEAMARGCAVIAANATALPEVVGDAGILVDPDDPDGWARAMIDLLQHDSRRAELGAAGLVRAASFTWGRSAEALADVYRTAGLSGHVRARGRG